MARKHYRVNKYKSTRGERLWRGFVYYPDDECPNPKHRYSKRGCPGHCEGLTGFTTEDDAREATAKRDAEITLGINLIPKRKKGMTLNEVADHFFAGPRPKKVSERTFNKIYPNYWNAAIRDTIGTIPVNDIGTLEVYNWIGDLATGKTSRSGKTLADGTMRRYMTALNRCGIKHAISPLAVTDANYTNPTLNIDISASLAEARDPIREFTPKEVIALAAAIPEDRPYRLLVLLGARYGFRISELFGLRRDDLEELEDARLVIHVRGQALDGEYVKRKSEAGVRSVTIDAQLSAAIRAHLIKFPMDETNKDGSLKNPDASCSPLPATRSSFGTQTSVAVSG